VPLGIREVLLVVRAQNLSSGVLRNVAGDFENLNGKAKAAAQQQMKTGTALMAVGAGVTAVGAAGILFLGKATAAAVEYNKQVALTKTQMYGVKASFDDVAQAGLDVAKKIAVPLDQVQSGLYDIFSSMDVNMSQAKFLLANFSKEAVAGQVDLSTAERASIGIMNAYKFKVQDVTKVQDILFNLVKYGVGTYGDFANSIGRVTGPAVRANQSFAETAAMMAFLTRNGLSASNAASSAGRALDAIGKSREKIQDVGKIVTSTLGDAVAKKLGITAGTMIKVKDAAGRLLPVNQIMSQLGTTLKGLSPTQLDDVLTAMFKGTGGTIQAMRFFDVAIHNFGQLNKLTKDMYTNRGALQAAYKIMSNTPAAKIQLLKNNFQALMITIGDQLLPVVGKLASALAAMFNWINKIPKPLLSVIVIIIAVTSVCLILAGVIMIVVGAWMVLSAILAASEIAFAPIIITVGLIIAAIVALAVAAYLIIKYWSPISSFWHDLWFGVWHWVNHFWGMIDSYVHGAFSKFINDWVKLGHNIEHLWHDIWPVLLTILKIGLTLLLVVWLSFWNIIRVPATAFARWIKSMSKAMWNALVSDWRAFSRTVANAWSALWTVVKNVFVNDWNTIKKVWHSVTSALEGDWRAFASTIRSAASSLWSAIVNGFNHKFWDPLKSSFSTGKKALIALWNGIKAPIAAPVNWIIKTFYDNGIRALWNQAARITNAPKLPFVGPVKFARGDIVNRPTLGVFGEAGPEVILPLSKPKRMMELLSKIGIPGFADGAIIPGAGSRFGPIPGVGGVTKQIAGWISKGVSNLGSLMFKPLEALINHVPGSGMVKTLVFDAGKKMLTNAIKFMTGQSSAGGSGGGLGSVKGATTRSARVAQAYAASLLAQYGWSQSMMAPLRSLWNEESGWSAFAVNAASGAYGIPQALGHGHPYALGDYKNQIIWGLNYIKGRYGNPAAAWAFETSHTPNWYGGGLDGGVFRKPTLIGVGDRPERVDITPLGRGGGSQPVQYISITTNEIDPRRHAAELGWELARRSA
jgi:TP901 family phage tail tape measure protein